MPRCCSRTRRIRASRSSSDDLRSGSCRRSRICARFVDRLLDAGDRQVAGHDRGGVQVASSATTCARRSTRSRAMAKCWSRTPTARGLDAFAADLRQAAGRGRPLLDRDRRPGRARRAPCRRRQAAARLPGLEPLGEPGARVASAIRPLAAVASATACAEPSRILVVDDNAANRDLLCRRLRASGHSVVAARGRHPRARIACAQRVRSRAARPDDAGHERL